MSTTPNPPPSPLEQAEETLNKIKKQQHIFNNEAAKPGSRLLGLCNAMGLVAFPPHQTILNNLGVERVQALRQEFLELLVEQCGYGNMTRLFTSATGLEMPLEPVPEAIEDEESTENEETPTARRWTRQNVINWVNKPIEPDVYGKIIGRKNHTTEILLPMLPYADTVVQLLGKYGPMTIYQLCAMISGQQPVDAPLTLYSRIQETVKLLKHKLMVSAYPITGWGAKNTNLWGLEPPGRIFYAVLNNQPTTSQSDAGDRFTQAQHTFGTNQVLATLAAIGATATRLGAFDNLLDEVLLANPKLKKYEHPGLEAEIPVVNMAKNLVWVMRPKSRLSREAYSGCQVDLMKPGTALEIGQLNRKAIVPDAMGRIAYDSELFIPTLTDACNLNEKEANFFGSTVTGRFHWSFILEYDRATETAEFFAEKVDGYSRLLNTIQTAWPLEWGGTFPVILVVVEGSPMRIVTLITAIKLALAKIKYNNPAHQRLSTWWFTNAEWFHHTFQQYLDPDISTAWLKKASKPNAKKQRGPKPKTATPTELTYGPDPHIWIPLDGRLDRTNLMEVGLYIKGQVAQPPKYMERLKAVPIPTVFNSLLFTGFDE